MQGETHTDELAWNMTGNANEIADILTEFANEVRKGDLVLWKQNDELHLDARGKLHLSVHGQNKGGQEGLSISMHWSS